MAKNKGKFGKAKSAVEESDEFVSGMAKLGERLKPHAVRIGFLVAGVAIVLIAYGIWSWHKDKKAKEATTQFDAALRVAQARIIGPDDAPDEPPAGEQPPSYPSVKARAEATLAELDKLGSEYGSTGVSKESVLLRANMLMDLGRYDEAATLYKDYASSGDVDELKLVAREGIGYALEEKALATEDPGQRQTELEEALHAFEQMQTKEDGVRRDHALFHQARILSVMERTDEAIAMYRKVLEVEDTPLKLEVENRLAELEAKK